MARGRMISKEICESDSFAALNNSNAQLLLTLLTSWWDDHGKMIGAEEWIRGNIVRKLKQFTIKEISRCLKLIDQKTDVQWWQDKNGNMWLYWPKFNTHQTISQEKKAIDKLPSPGIPKTPQDSPREAKDCPPQDQVEVEEEVEEEVEGIVADLNLVFESNYNPKTKTTKELIHARLNEGFTVDDFKCVHRKMLRAWGTSEKMVKFLRPITLYSNKFESYLNMLLPTTKLTETGLKAYLIGKAWLESHKDE